MTSLLDARLDGRLLGSETPRVWTYPEAVSSSGDELADFAAEFGLNLLPWQRLALRCAMGERGDGRWAAGEVGIVVPRQNGKGSIIEARELGGLFLLGERLITHTAHEFKTSQEAFRRIRSIIDGSDELTRRVKSIVKMPNPTVELLNGNRLTFVARSGGSGRGFSGDLVILDEAYDLTVDQMDALIPTLTTAPDPQIWYTSSAGRAHSEVLASVRRRGVDGSPKLAYMEWSIPEPRPNDPPINLTDLRLVAQANPSYPAFVSNDFLELERGALSYEGLLRERYGVWDAVGAGDGLREAWPELADRSASPPRPVGKVAFAVHSRFDRSSTAISVCGVRPDGRVQVQVLDSRPGVTWAVARLAELRASWPTCAVVLDPRSAVGSLLPDLAEAGVEVDEMTAHDVAQAFGMFHDAAVDRSLVHLDQPELNSALAAATRRPIGEAWTWDGRADVDIEALVSATNALWGWTTRHASGGLQIF